MTGLAYLWLGVIAGVAATPHCAGMCGPFPLHLARAGGPGRPLVRHLLYLLGKTFTYAFLGALAGLLGRLIVQSKTIAYSQQALAYGMGAGMIVFGLTMLGAFGWIRLPATWSDGGRLVGTLYRDLAGAPGGGAALLLGVGTGFLPCPITFAMLAAAAGSHSVALGMAVMGGLGVGTSAVLLGIGVSGTLVDTRVRRIGLRGAGVIVMLVGVVTLLRPTGLLCRVLPASGLPVAAHEGRR